MENIIKDYQSQNYSIEDIAKKYKIGKLKVKQILIDNNIPIRKKGNQKKIIETNFVIDINNKMLECKKCNKVFKDIENKSGAITEHISSCYDDVIIPTKYIRSNYKKTNGTYWHFQYFNIIDKSIEEKLNCPICDWVTYDITNKTGSFTKHIENSHSSVDEFLQRYPIYSHLFSVHNKIKIRKKELNEDYVECKLCNQKFKSITNKHLLHKHNITVEEYKLKFPFVQIINKEQSQKLKKKIKEVNKNIKHNWTSNGEKEIFDIIKNKGFDVEKSKNRKLLEGKEIDIVIDNLKICLEYNGLYYHTDAMGKDRTYHLNKTLECKKLGYNLIHIFEDEWINNKDIVLDKIDNLLGTCKIKIGARKTEIKIIDKNIKSEFLNKNHIQGNDKSNIYYGAYYNEDLVGVMTFSSKRNMTSNKENEYELTRFATKIGHNIQGLASKFLNRFIKDFKPISIISFADIRWTPNENNNLYTKLGFELVSILPPNYFYYNSKYNKYKRYHKFNFGKNNIIKKFPDVDISKSESHIMKEKGFNKIWDCGLYKYEYKIKNPQ